MGGSSLNRRGWCKRSKFGEGLADSPGSDRRFSCGLHGSLEGRYRLGHRPVGLDEPLWQSGVGSGSMYSQAYVSADGVGGQRASVALCDRSSELKIEARGAERR